MPTDSLFQVANTAALASWLALVFLPRLRSIIFAIKWGVVLSLCVLYTVLIFVYFFGVKDGGFFSLQAVQRLFESPHVALAGWMHYLAFDLLIGLVIVQQSTAIGLTRLIQAPILLTTFMFGPMGWLLFQGVLAAQRSAASKQAEPCAHTAHTTSTEGFQ